MSELNIKYENKMDEMIGSMARSMYKMLIAMGFMIVMLSFLIGFWNSTLAGEYFSATKTTRETTLMSTRVVIEQVGQILPYFKFLGVGMILAGIVMALRVIIDRLRSLGNDVLANLPESNRPAVPSPPGYAMLMPMLMMLGLMIFLLALIVSLWLGFGDVATVFANAFPTIDAAGSGSALNNALVNIKATNAWLVPFKFFAIAIEFLAIANGLAVIIYILTHQTDTLEDAILRG